MAKTESTAVNELIELVATAKPLPPDPDEDLMFKEPVQAPAPKKTTRMTATVPPIKGAGEVAPLPHTRAASGTHSGFPVVPPPVRVSTAPPSRGATIPPLPPPTAPNPNKQTLMGNGPGLPPSPAATLPPPAPNPSKQTLMGTGSIPPMQSPSLPPTNAADLRSTLMGPGTGEPQRPSRPTKPSLPPPRPSGPPAPFTPRATLPPSAPISAQIAAPVAPPMAAPFDPSIEASIDVPFDVSPPPARLPADEPFASSPAYAATIFPAQDAPEHLPLDSALGNVSVPPEWYGSTLVDQSGEPWVGTARVPKQSDWKSIAGKLVGPMLGLVVLGIFIGGYFAFDGEGGKKARTSPPAKQVAATEPLKPVLGDNAKAVAGDPAAAPAHSEAPKTDVASTEPAHSDAAHSDSAKSEPAHSEAAKTDVATSEPAKTEPAKTEPAKTEPAKTEPAKAEPAKAEHAPAPAKVAVAEPAVVTPPNLAPNHTAPGGLVDVRIDTKPAGATVMLVDRGKTMFLGTTPISTSLDPSRKYDLVFTYASKPTQVEHLDPATTKHVAIVLGVTGNQAGKTVAPPKVETPKAPAIASAPKAEPKPVTAPKIETPKFEAPKAEAPKAEKPEKPEKPAPEKAEKPEKAANDDSIRKGQGTLMISSKPPCEIIVDGKSTGLTTPQRAIPLPAGTHKVTLVNSAENIKKTVAITITADQPTKVIQDLMQK